VNPDKVTLSKLADGMILNQRMLAPLLNIIPAYSSGLSLFIDLKLGDLTHQDLGQMQMYVNYYTREMMNEGDNPPIGIVLCADKSDTVVKYTLSEQNTQIFASKYKLYLPTEDELRLELQREYNALESEAK